MLRNLLLIALLIAVTVLVIVQVVETKENYRYVNNSELFEGFNGTKFLKEKIKNLSKEHQLKIDSIVSLDVYDLSKINKIKHQFSVKEKEVADQYSSDIWKSLNQLVKRYSKENDIDFVLGANGSGSLMYADSSLNITDQVIKYVNDNYEGSN